MPIFVNKVEITDDEIHAEMQYHPANSIEEARHKAAEALVIRQLLLQAAHEKNLLTDVNTATDKDVDKVISKLIQQEVSVPQADAPVCKRYYEQNAARFLDKKSGQQLPFESVFEYIRDYLHARSLQTGINQYIKILSGQARIAGFDLEGSDNPLVQ